RRAGVPVVIGERSAPSVVLSPANRALAWPGLWRLIARRMYPRASAVVANTAGAKRELVSSFGVDADRVTVLPNPVDLERLPSLADEAVTDAWWPRDPACPILVHVGRFTYAKDHDTLLRAFAIVRQRRPSTLALVGSGEDESRIRDLIRALDLETDVRCIGFTRNPYKYL